MWAQKVIFSGEGDADLRTQFISAYSDSSQTDGQGPILLA
jgi:hypothetical protein